MLFSSLRDKSILFDTSPGEDCLLEKYDSNLKVEKVFKNRTYHIFFCTYFARGLVCIITLFPLVNLLLSLASFFKFNFLQPNFGEETFSNRLSPILSRLFIDGGDSSSPSNKDFRLNCGKFLRICGVLFGVGIGETL